MILQTCMTLFAYSFTPSIPKSNKIKCAIRNQSAFVPFMSYTLLLQLCCICCGPEIILNYVNGANLVKNMYVSSIHAMHKVPRFSALFYMEVCVVVFFSFVKYSGPTCVTDTIIVLFVYLVHLVLGVGCVQAEAQPCEHQCFTQFSI